MMPAAPCPGFEPHEAWGSRFIGGSGAEQTWASPQPYSKKSYATETHASTLLRLHLCLTRSFTGLQMIDVISPYHSLTGSLESSRNNLPVRTLHTDEFHG